MSDSFDKIVLAYSGGLDTSVILKWLIETYECDVIAFSANIGQDDEVNQIKEIVSTCNGISRTELANTVCELFNWKRPTGRLKTVECRQFLEHLAAKGVLDLPDRKAGRPKGVNLNVARNS